MGISAETDLNILWESATILRGGRFFHTQNQEEVNNMKEFWNVIQMVFTAVGGWLGYFLGGNDGLLMSRQQKSFCAM